MSSARKSESLKFTSSVNLPSRNVLSAEEAELFELTQLSGVVMDPKVFK